MFTFVKIIFIIMQKYVIIAAGGIGSRMQHELPKQFILVHMKPVICYTIEKFIQAFEDIQIIITVPEHYMETARSIVEQYFPTNKINIVIGGSARYHSIQNGLSSIDSQDGIVFIHDAARCLVSVQLIHNCYNATLTNGNAIPCTIPTDSLRIIDTVNSRILNRNKVRHIQTPQTFYVKDIKKGFEKDYDESFTDEASVMESIGVEINLIEGDVQNIKLTTPFDLDFVHFLIGKIANEVPT
jgi:2-C-methyl-D-erythritol 4-phosphate cytidylyltransferase